MEVSALRYSGGLGLHGRTPLLRLQSDERLIAFIRRGNNSAFEVLFSRYQSRLLAFCRHLLSSREDAEDVLQEVMTAAFNAILADDRAINVRPWLYRIARNRSLNHLRRIQAIGVDSMDVHFSEAGASTADKVHDREQFRMLVGDIQELPETQRTALVLREMDALSYEQIAEAMETTVPGVKSLLVRARIALAEAAEARQLSCEDVRLELGEVAEGIRKKPDALARRHLRSCTRCSTFQGQLKKTNRALAALLPLGPLALLRKLAILHIGHSAGTGSGAAGSTAGATTAGATTAGAGAGAAGTGAGAGAAGVSALGSAGSALSAGAGALAGKAAAGLAAAAIVTAGAVEVTHVTHRRSQATPGIATAHAGAAGRRPDTATADQTRLTAIDKVKPRKAAGHHVAKTAADKVPAKSPTKLASVTPTPKPTGKSATPAKPDPQPAPGRTQTQSDATVLTAQPTGPGTSAPSSEPAGSGSSSGTTGPTGPATGPDTGSGGTGSGAGSGPGYGSGSGSGPGYGSGGAGGYGSSGSGSGSGSGSTGTGTGTGTGGPGSGSTLPPGSPPPDGIVPTWDGSGIAPIS
jgi:RNA polymerase sigma factor (sigma-70 family)